MREMWDGIAVEWNSADVEPDIRLHYGLTGNGERLLVLVHGDPQMAYAWRRVVPLLVKAGVRVVLPDYRGAGGSSKPPGGYGKRTMAADLHALVYDHLGQVGPVTILGHEIGMMVAYAVARRFPGDTERLVVMEAPLPGTEAYGLSLLDTRRLWHFHFHRALDLPELLTAGREQLYLERFYQDVAYDTQAIDCDAVARDVRGFARPSAMRAVFELYRAFPEDDTHNRVELERKGPLTLPVLALAGAHSGFAPFTESMMREVATVVTFKTIASANHWIPEENAEGLAKAILVFLDAGRAGDGSQSMEREPPPHRGECIPPTPGPTRTRVPGALTWSATLPYAWPNDIRRRYGRGGWIRAEGESAEATLAGSRRSASTGTAIACPDRFLFRRCRRAD